MTRKEQEITELYLETIKNVSNDKEKWLSFLKSASFNYKYRFDEQILIYAQKPQSTAVAETEVWNKKLKRWINKGSKGIALMTEKDGEIGLRFVFDVSDTNSNVYGRKFKLWTAQEQYHNDIIETLEDKFGTMESKDNLQFAIISTVFNLVQDNIQDYTEQLKNVTKDSKLETLEDKELQEKFEQIVMFSTMAITLTRCGLNVEDYIPIETFENISLFDTFDTMTILGTATRDFSKEILLEVSKTVINLQKQEKNTIHTFDKNKQEVYDKIIKNMKGSVDNEYNLQGEGKLSNTRPSSTTEQVQQNQIGEISTNEATIPKGEQDRNVRNITNEQQIERTLDRNRENSETQNRTNSRTDETTRTDNRRIESQRPNDLGRQDEQYSSNSRTDSDKGTNTSIEEQNPKEVDNTSFFNAEDYHLRAGDKFFIGETEFTILTINNEEMTIYESERPLYQQTVTIKDIINKIAENPINDYLKEDRPQEEKEQEESRDISFNNWLDTFIEEKGIALDDIFTIEENGEQHIFEIGNIVENIKATTPKEQAEIKDMIVRIDFHNGDVIDYFKHLAKALVMNYQQEKEEINTPVSQTLVERLHEFLNEYDIYDVDEVTIDEVENTLNDSEKIRDTIEYFYELLNHEDIVDEFSDKLKGFIEELESLEQRTEQEKNKVNEEIAQKITKRNRNRNIEYFDLHPEIPSEERNNFKITDDLLGIGTAKEKFKNNIEAIKILKLCENQDRYATPEEQKILSKYVRLGWLEISI